MAPKTRAPPGWANQTRALGREAPRWRRPPGLLPGGRRRYRSAGRRRKKSPRPARPL